MYIKIYFSKPRREPRNYKYEVKPLDPIYIEKYRKEIENKKGAEYPFNSNTEKFLPLASYKLHESRLLNEKPQPDPDYKIPLPDLADKSKNKYTGVFKRIERGIIFGPEFKLKHKTLLEQYKKEDKKKEEEQIGNCPISNKFYNYYHNKEIKKMSKMPPKY